MDFRILGSLEVLDEGRPIALGGDKQRALLAVLLLHANETLSTERLIDELWAENPPATAAKTVQVHVSRLRKALVGESAGGRPDPVVTRERGYRLTLDPESLDANRFERLLDEARTELAGLRPARAAEILDEALALWRGDPLADLSYEPFAQGEIARLGDLRVAALELLVDAKLALGAHAEVVGQLEALIGEYPYRERLRAQLMLALYRSERQADALQAYQNARSKLVEELGIEPGERLRDLERAILAQDPALALPAVELAQPDSPPPPPPPVAAAGSRPARRLVSIVFADLVGSTGLGERLDPESMHALLDRYTEVCSAVIERHGGTVEGFIGDAVVGVFGLTELHEDDGLRAVRAAVELRDAGAALNAELEREHGVSIAMKFGVDSGEVFVSGGARRRSFAAGDAFNVAARLEGIAAEGQILLGDNVYRLVQADVRAERLEPLALKGRTAKVQAWRLVDLEAGDPAVPPPSSATRFVGRGRELDDLHAAFARACEQRVCQAVTVVGAAGIGKSRLVRELLVELGDRATVVVGRCQSYGEGVTYRPLAEIVRQLGGGDPRERVEELLEGDESIARLVLGAIGLADAPAQPEETFWAVRMLLERAARDRPLVVIVEDVHWAEPTLVDLLEYLVAFSSGHPILLVCNARPEFVEARPAWVAPQPNRTLLALVALSDPEARELVESTGAEAGSAAAARIVDTAEGNPLFLEQLVAVGADPGGAALPSSIQAVLAARIDRLDSGERAVLEHASVQGRSFYVGAVAELMAEPERARIATHVVSLVRQQLLRADRSDLPGEDAFRFAHVLIREAAYQGLPKQRRAEVHEQVAWWLDGSPDAEDETIGYHLGEAYRNLTDLGREGERERTLAASAAERLAAAADAALVRGDPPGGARLLERAAALMPPDDPARVALLPRLGAALLEAGRVADAERVLVEAIEAAGDDPRLDARARVELQLVRLQAGSDAPVEDTARIADAALRVLEAHADELGQCRALCLRARHEWVEGRSARADEAWRRAAGHARRAHDEAVLFEILDWRTAAALFGPTPVPAAIDLCHEIHERVESNPVAAARTFPPMAALHAMAGDFDEARRLIRAGDEVLAEVGGMQSAVGQEEALVEMLAGRPAAAETRLRAGCERLEEMGERALLAGSAAMLAQALFAQERYEEAAGLCRLSEESAAEDDLSAQVGWRAVRAKLLAGEGRQREGEALAAQAVTLAERTDFLTVHAEALLDLGAVLRDGGQPDEAEAATRAALDLYRRKGDVVSTERARSLLAAGARR